MKPMVFDGTEIQIISRDGEAWVAATDLASALGYERSDKVTRLYHRHIDEFTESMSGTLKVGFSGNLQKKVRVFSLRGAHLVAMFARTRRAKAFRRWVLDILDALHSGGEYVQRKYQEALRSLEDRRVQASEEGRGLSKWRWEKQPLQMSADYWRERQQLSLALN